MTERSILVHNPTEQIRTNVETVLSLDADDADLELLLLTVAGGNATEATMAYGVFALPFVNYSLPGPTFFIRLLRSLRGADLVFVAEYEYLTSVLCVLAARALGKPVILTTDALVGVNWHYPNQAVDMVLRAYTHTIGRVVFNLANEVVVFCDCHERDIRRFVRHDDVHVLPNGVDLDRFTVEDSKDVTWPAEVDLLYVGRLDRVKGFRLLLEALVELPDAGFHLDVVGTGDIEPSYRSLCDEYDIADVVTFHGWQEAVEEYYRRADLFVLASFAEGQPTVVLEAQASGVPVVSTDVGCVRELLGSGALVGDRDPTHFAEAIRSLLDRDYEALRVQAREHVEPAYGRERSARRYLELLTGA